MEPLLLGIDIGTSGCKVTLFTTAGAVLGQQTEPYPVLYPKAGWAEQNPLEWWNASANAIRLLLQRLCIPPASIAGIGVDGQSWAAVALDAKGTVLTNTPIWMDTRAHSICTELKNTYGEAAFFSVSGNPLTPSYTLPKILWYQRHLPEVYKKTTCILQSNSYIVYQLTGVLSQDISQGYGLHCFAMQTGQWDDTLCKELAIDPALLPEISPCHQVVGRVTPAAGRLTGLLPGTPVVAGGLDAACASLGAGVIHPGDTQEQGGQAGGMSICTATYHADPRLIVSYHVIPGHWLLQGGTTGGGGVLHWLEQELGAPERALAAENGTSSFYELDQLATRIPPGSDGLLFLPYMAGERSPIWNPHAKGVYYGLDFTKTKGHFIRAGLEGVGYALQHNLTIAEQAGVPVALLRAMGGSANSRLWTQIKADITGKTIEVPATDTATTWGAALLAGVGVGLYPSFAEAVAQTVSVQRTHTPNPENSKIYQQGYQHYLRLYQLLSPMMQGEDSP